MKRRPLTPARARSRPLILAAAVTSALCLTGSAGAAGAFGWVAWAVALGALAVGGWAVAVFFAYLTRPGWTAQEKTVLRGGMDARELFEAFPGRKGPQ